MYSRMQINKCKAEWRQWFISRAREGSHMSADRLTQVLDSPAVMGSLYALGPIVIVFGALITGWVIMWRCILVKMSFVREIFDLPPTKRKVT